MKKLILILVVSFAVINCKKNEILNHKKNEIDVVVLKKPIRNEVVIKCDSIKELSMNIWTSEFQMKPDLLVIGQKNNLMIIPTDSILKLKIMKSYLFSVGGDFIIGDTIYISKKQSLFNGKVIAYPFITVTNRNVNNYELNFDYYVSNKTPTKRTFKWYNYFIKRKKIKNPSTINDVYDNTIKIADSLHSKNLISDFFYNRELQEIKILKAQDVLNQAYLNKTEIKINSLGILLSDTLFLDSDIYKQYLITVFKYKHFFNAKRRIRNSKLFDLVEKDISLVPVIKNTVLDDLLIKIYATERIKFNDCIEKLKLNPADYSSLIKKYDIVIANGNSDRVFNETLKGSSGKLLFLNKNKKELKEFQQILKKEKGKVILVDFWASWCAPCRKEMPYLKSLLKEMDSKKFTIISISTDKKYSSWERASLQENLVENNYLLIDAKNSSLITDFKISTIPRYLLYDKKGNLVKSNAPRPSKKKELGLLLNKYLTE